MDHIEESEEKLHHILIKVKSDCIENASDYIQYIANKTLMCKKCLRSKYGIKWIKIKELKEINQNTNDLKEILGEVLHYETYEKMEKLGYDMKTAYLNKIENILIESRKIALENLQEELLSIISIAWKKYTKKSSHKKLINKISNFSQLLLCYTLKYEYLTKEIIKLIDIIDNYDILQSGFISLHTWHNHFLDTTMHHIELEDGEGEGIHPYGKETFYFLLVRSESDHADLPNCYWKHYLKERG